MTNRGIFTAVLALFVFLVSFSFHLVKAPPEEMAVEKPWRLFHYENAIHYYIADQINRHGLAALEENERILSGEKTNILQQFTVAMELFPVAMMKMGFYEHLSQAVMTSSHLFFALKNTLVFLLLWSLCQLNWLAFAGSLIYLINPEHYLRSMHRPFLRDEFGIPCILLAIILFIWAYRQRSWLISLLAGLAFSLSLAAWHFSPFLLLPACFLFAYVLLFHVELETFSPNLWLFLLPPIYLACFLVPVLWHSNTILSPAVVFLTLTPLLVYGRYKNFDWLQAGWQRFLALSVTGLVSLVPGLLFNDGQYDQAAILLSAKIKHLGIKPENPLELSTVARIFWHGELMSPSLAMWFKFLLYPAALALALLAYLSMKGAKLTRPGFGFFILLGIGIILTWVVQRNIAISGIFFVAAIVAYFSTFNDKLDFKASMPFIMAAALVFLLPWRSNDPVLSPEGRRFDGVVKYLNSVDSSKLTIAGQYYQLPPLLAFTNVTILNHSKWESGRVRTRTVEFLDVMFKPINEFNIYMKRYQGNAILVSKEIGYAGFLYQAGYRGPFDRNLTSCFFYSFDPAQDRRGYEPYFIDNKAEFLLLGLKSKMPGQIKPISYSF